YLLFSAIVVGVSGEMTSQDGITGLLNFLNPVVVKIGIIIAVLAIATSFISLGHVLRDLYHEDLSISSSLSWILVIVPPMAIYLMDHVTFVEVLEFSGAVTVGISGLLLGMMYLKVKSKESKNLLVINAPSVLVYASIGVFIAGVMYEIVKGLL
ncbi:hypothetical protein KC571_03750, partial [candidate division WWE3 bacterium]|nr:hypothetical protein [candidate division WWE3 bacterium]